ncbi:MAG TPA: methylamine utilization protein [Burkholderiaceae bacterium]|jgi:plastocyanin
MPNLRLALSFALLMMLGSQVQAAPWAIVVRDAAGKPLTDAVVAVQVRGKPLKTTTATAAMAQKDRQFVPQLLVVQTGTQVSFPNQDTVRHQVYSFSPIKVFELKLYAGSSTPVTFDKPGVATLGCNIHDRMSAHIVVVDTPLFARTDTSGTARLDLPAGEHVLQVWHEQMNAPALQTQPLSITTDAAGSTTVTISE